MNFVLQGKEDSRKTETYVKNCKSYEVTTTTSTSTTGGSSSGIKYNIHAKTKKFGYFGWNINMDCFYALNNFSSTGDTSITEKVEANCSSGARVRSINLEDVFPNTDGSTHPDNTFGREPGYNWSKYAINNKNSEYVSNPVKYLSKIQDLKYGVYSDEYLDYEFDLDTAALSKLRQSFNDSNGKNGNYTNFDSSGDKNGTFTKTSNLSSDKGIVRYRSKVIRTIKGKYQPINSAALKCNNMLNYSKSGCDTSAN